MRKMYQRSESNQKFGMPQEAMASIRQELFNKTTVSRLVALFSTRPSSLTFPFPFLSLQAETASRIATHDSFVNPRHRNSTTIKPPDSVQHFDFAEEVAPSWQTVEAEAAPETPGRDPLLVRSVSPDPSHPAALTDLPPSFSQSLGIRPIIVSRLKTQFPEVVEPTAFQTALIHGIVSGRDVVAKEDTGEGK